LAKEDVGRCERRVAADFRFSEWGEPLCPSVAACLEPMTTARTRRR
jgi:hypothetical protein